jgi:hypothetical protein
MPAPPPMTDRDPTGGPHGLLRWTAPSRRRRSGCGVRGLHLFLEGFARRRSAAAWWLSDRVSRAWRSFVAGRLGPASGRQQSAVHGQRDAGDVASRVAGEENQRGGEFVAVAETSNKDSQPVSVSSWISAGSRSGRNAAIAQKHALNDTTMTVRAPPMS